MTDKVKFFIKKDDKYRYIEYEPLNVVASDTDSVYLDLSDLFERHTELEKVYKKSIEISEEINKSFPEFIECLFNIPKERHNILQTELEVCSSKSIFLGKKQYAMFTDMVDGMVVNKLKYMGIAIKRTDTPKVIQYFLSELVNQLMDQKSFEEIQSFIDIFKEKYHNMNLLDIGRPTGLKSFKKYEVAYQRNNTMKGFPYHVRAALFYNSLCGINDKKIVSGDKIRIVYINHPRSKYIALPVDIEEYPSFVDGLHINWIAQWETVVKKINIFLEPIGYDRDSRQKKLIKSILKF